LQRAQTMRWKRPRKPWTAKELADLDIPAPEFVDGKVVHDTEQRQKFFAESYRRTGYRIDELIPLGHALQLITGLHSSGRAREKAVQYLMHGFYWHNSKMLLQEFGVLKSTEAVLEEDDSGRKSTVLRARGMMYHRSFSPIPATLEAIEKAWQPFVEPLKPWKFSKREAEQYLNLYKDGLTWWQFISLGKMLATAKLKIRTRANRRPRQEETKRFRKKEEKG